ncbi:MAG TPA: hypothetical protein VF702_00410 [Allosphingosinicella sp.]
MRLPIASGAAVAALIAASAAAVVAQQPSLPAAKVAEDDQVTAPAAAPTAPAAAAPATPAAPAPPPTAEDRRRLVAAGQRGILLFEIARAGQLTTQDMLARVADPSEAGIAGWVATPDDAGTMTVVYYAETPEGPVAVYRGRVAGNRITARDVFAGAERPALTPIQRRMAAARAAVANLDRQPCGGVFNVFVIPPAAAEGPVEVYKLSPQTQRGRYPLGGHFLATVAADGSIASTRAFTNRCLDLEAPLELAGAPPRPLGVTHLLDPLPTEIHVFLSLWMNRPLLVATGSPERVWSISRGRIGIVGASASRPPPPGPGR